MRRLWLLLVCVVVLATPASAADWTYASSDHFEIYTTGGSRRAREALTYFERVHAFFSEYLKLSPKTTTPTRLIVFSNAKEFRPFRFNDVAVAYYRQGPDRDYIVMESLGEEAYPIVVHEYAHLLMRHGNTRYPLWLNEGLAEFFSTLAPYGGEMSIGRVPRGRLQYLASGERMFDLERLFAVTHDSLEYRTENHAGVFYSQSWALTHMLLTDQRYRQASGKFLQLMDAGVDSAAALSQVYGRSMKAIFTDLSSYVHNDRFVFLTAQYKLPKDGSAFSERRASPFEAGLVTANLLAAGREGEDKARAAFDDLARQNADDLSLVESRADFEWRAGHGEAARTYFARAVELGSTNARIYRDYARLSGVDVATAEALLRTAISLEPDNVQARGRLAFLLLNREAPAEALATLAPVTRSTADDAFNIAQLRANAYLQLRNVTAARAAALEASQAAADDEQRSYVARLLRSLDDYANNQAVIAKMLAAREAGPAEPTPGGSNLAAAFTETAGATTRSIDGLELEFVSGQLTSVSCLVPPSVQVRTAQGVLRFAVDAPQFVRVFGAASTTIDLQCGVQDKKIRIGFHRTTPAAGPMVGSLRVLDYR